MSNYQLSLIMLACISVITVSGVFSMTSLAGMFSLGQAAYMSISAYLAFCLAYYLQIPIWLTIIIGLLGCAIVALVIGAPTLKLRRDYFALMTVAFGQMVAAIVILLSEYTNASIGFSRIPKVKNLLYIILAITVLVVFMVRNLKYSRFGRMAMALKTDEIAARSFGIDVYRLKMKIYVFASIIAGTGGICYGLRNRVIAPGAFDWSKSSEMQIMLFFGGTNSLTGAIVSAIGLTILPEFLKGVQVFGADLQSYKTIIYCVLILVVINFRTQGLFGETELNFNSLKKWSEKHMPKAKARNAGEDK
ncbi:MAG: branched-chain amino acid ABC transporter permease [Fastidiosipila sp.]|nr:branched-chain amino acid ABC transporter permease [Fastidiosipila sp.]